MLAIQYLQDAPHHLRLTQGEDQWHSRARLAAGVLAFCSRADSALSHLKGSAVVPAADGAMKPLGSKAILATATEQVSVEDNGVGRELVCR